MTQPDRTPDAEKQRWDGLALEAASAFRPTTPVDERALFAGRTAQVRRVLDVILQKGQHAMIYGERGVGKTSLSNVLSQFLSDVESGTILAPRVNCDTEDSFASVWRKVFQRIELTRTQPGTGFAARERMTKLTADALALGDALTPDTVRGVLFNIAEGSLPILIVDEFDRLQQGPRRAFADLIKTLSDNAIPATVVLVGVADSVEQLIEEHESVARALVQIQMPRMSNDEIASIIATGLGRLGMSIRDESRDTITLLAQGLPHYAHLLGLHAARAALDSRTMEIGPEHLSAAIGRAIEDAQQTIRTAYHRAIRSARRQNLFADVLLACALARLDPLGFFAAQDVRGPMREITGKPYDIPTFARHLNEFTGQSRGRILKKTGERRRYRFRFSDPLMQPFVIMQGLTAHRVPAAYTSGQATRERVS